MSFVTAVMSSTTTAPGVTGTTASLPVIDSQGFLRLLITQLQHQDPVSPTDPGETVQQLAALAQVSTLQEINASLKQLLASKGNSTTG